MEAMTRTDIIFPGSQNVYLNQKPKLIFFQWKSHRWGTGWVIRELAIPSPVDLGPQLIDKRQPIRLTRFDSRTQVFEAFDIA